ncbi:EthD domain-containing protein [Paraburkholderia sp. LEh10]|uniref:EthD domain-containing protein n=1 Tax=Paraburkholderia sp. LEh10 TaxID=2821353 RepID=UPI001AE12559|nr:EthD domain-containing protein [Paraburkholderia sp. LEh10]MBP0590467.1 EthD domain-containing protein [Paraburkholderia sp. LEh10]
MWVSVSFYKRKPGTSHEEFSRHWREIHGPLIAKNPKIARHIKRYVQHHLQPNASVPGVQELEFDGFSEVWFESMEDRQAMFAEPDFQNLVIPDEHNFIDMSITRTSMSDTPVVQV